MGELCLPPPKACRLPLGVRSLLLYFKICRRRLEVSWDFYNASKHGIAALEEQAAQLRVTPKLQLGTAAERRRALRKYAGVGSKQQLQQLATVVQRRRQHIHELDEEARRESEYERVQEMRGMMYHRAHMAGVAARCSWSWQWLLQSFTGASNEQQLLRLQEQAQQWQEAVKKMGPEARHEALAEQQQEERDMLRFVAAKLGGANPR
uniref:Uncharacterized protein n=1 Tax=Tetradesmus obliquus TaxID=3088 RepID=A0A383W4A1_TETOB|eukprot:jgi/Sobl393_1/11184/SZX71952.1